MTPPPPTAIRRRKLATDAIANWIAFATQIAVAFVMAPVLLHGLGVNHYGWWCLIQSVVGYLALLDMGIGAAVVRFVAKFESTADDDQLNRIFCTSLFVFSLAGLTATVTACLIAFMADTIFTVPPPLLPTIQVVLVLLGMNIGLELPLAVFGALLTGLQRYATLSVLRTSGGIVRAIALYLAIVNGGGLIALASISLAAMLLERTMITIAALRAYPKLRLSWSNITRDTWREISGYSVRAFTIQVCGRISYHTDSIVIGLFLAPAYVSYFAVAAALTERSKSSIGVLTYVLRTAASRLEGLGDTERLRKLYIESTRYALYLVVPLEAGLIVIARPFLELWMGPDIAQQSYPTAVVLAIAVLPLLAQNPGITMLYGVGNLNLLSRIRIIESICNLVLSVILVRPLGILGVALGTTIPSVVASLVLARYTMKLQQVRFREYFAHCLLKPFLGLPVLLGVWWVLLEAHPADSWIRLILVSLAGLSGYFAIAAILEFGPRVLWGWGLFPRNEVANRSSSP